MTNAYAAGYAAGEPLVTASADRRVRRWSPLVVPENTLPIDVYKTAPNQPLIGGFIKIEQQRINGLWYDVTQEILATGHRGPEPGDQHRRHREPLEQSGHRRAPDVNPNAVIRLQRVRDVPVHRPPAPPPST